MKIKTESFDYLNQYPFAVDITRLPSMLVQMSTYKFVDWVRFREIKQWCEKNLKYCEHSIDLQWIRFRTEQDKTLFLLRWG